MIRALFTALHFKTIITRFNTQPPTQKQIQNQKRKLRTIQKIPNKTQQAKQTHRQFCMKPNGKEKNRIEKDFSPRKKETLIRPHFEKIKLITEIDQPSLQLKLSENYQSTINMQQTAEQEPLQEPIPAYAVRINTSAFNHKKPSLLHKTQEQCIPKYWLKLGMDQKTIRPSCEDRLSELTTSQIDRIIDMEKIRSFLNSRKKKEKQTYFHFNPINNNSHPNVYQANFLAKINHIAIRRNIRHEGAEGFGEYSSEQPIQADKKIAKAAYKYRKCYESQQELNRPQKSHHAEQDDQKSISSIQDELEQFEQKLENSKQQLQTQLSRRERKKSEYANGVKKRWFYGLSNLFVSQEKDKPASRTEIKRVKSVDIESQLTHLSVAPLKQQCKKSHIKTMSTHYSSSFRRSQQPLQKFKISKIVNLP